MMRIPVCRLFLFMLAVVAALTPSAENAQIQDPNHILAEADRLGLLFNWPKAEPLYAQAVALFNQSGDKRNAVYARLSWIWSQADTGATTKFQGELDNDIQNPLVQSDPTLMIRCLVAKAAVQYAKNESSAEDDWEEILKLANASHDDIWQARAKAELGTIAFLDGDVEKATRLLKAALISSYFHADLGAAIYYGSIVGNGLVEVGQPEAGLQYCDTALKTTATTKDVGFPFMAYEGKARALVALHQVNCGSRRPQSSMVFSDFWVEYFDPEVISKRKISTQQMYRYLGGKHLLPYFGKRRLCDLERGELQEFINLKERSQYSPQTVRHLRNILSKFFGAAMSKELLTTNLARSLEMPTMKKVRQSRVLTLEEIADLLRAFDEELRAVFLFGLLPGLRIGEILGLMLEDIDLNGRFFWVRRNVYRGIVQDRPKTPAGYRTLPIASALHEGLQAWLAIRPQGSQWVFPNDAGNPYYDRNLLRRKVWPACDRLSIPHFGWHSLRHTFSTYGGNSGVPLPVLQSLLGHTSMENTMIYTHPLLEAERRAVEQIASILLPSAPKLASARSGGKQLIQ